jgi:hypothetical protein
MTEKSYPALSLYDIQNIAESLGKSSRSGRGWVTQCLIHEDKEPSLSLSLGHQGELLAYCHAGCSFQEIVKALKRRGFLSDYKKHSFGFRKRGEKGELAEFQHFLRRKEGEIEANRGEDFNFKRLRYVRELWSQAQPVKGTLAEAYLNKRLDGRLTQIPPTLRFLPTLKHTPSSNFYPCLIAAVTRFPDKKIIALHRTYLAPDGRGKAPVEKPKMLLGDAKGGAIRLAPATEELVMTEGIEDGLSLWLILHKPVWVGCSARLLENVMLPALPLASTVYIAQDNDEAGQKATGILGKRLYAEGRIVKILTPPQQYKDFNHIIQHNKHIESPTKDSIEPSRKEIR